MDERITLKEKDKIPYGYAAARDLAKTLFPDANFSSDKRSPGYWDDISSTSGKQAVVIISGYFNADEYELKQLSRFVENGNYVFIIAKSFSTEAQDAFHFSYNQNDLTDIINGSEDSLRVQLTKPSFSSDSFYVYPGRKFESWFEDLDTTHALILGRNDSLKPNFIRMDRGMGSFYIHSAPLTFSNYFILHKNNIHYFEQVMSVIPRDVNTVVWNEFYLSKRSSGGNGNNDSDGRKEPNWLGVLLRYKEFRWGLLTVLLGILLYVLLGSRRRQRMIPPYPKPANDSLDFVKTMGRLYFDRKDHGNLAKKMAMYFLEHVRSTYKLSTHELDEAFIQRLHYKSGYGKEELNEIISFITYLQNDHSVTEDQLTNFHNQLEAFYQTT